VVGAHRQDLGFDSQPTKKKKEFFRVTYLFPFAATKVYHERSDLKQYRFTLLYFGYQKSKIDLTILMSWYSKQGLLNWKL
jgi:hypothetical protein